MSGGMSQPRLILHNYGLSTFSEKIRRILAYKGLDYCHVETPMVMPKPELMRLTGGYRRIPVLQIGADIYCDTDLIARKLEEIQPEPPIYPAGRELEMRAITELADRKAFFWAVQPTFADLLPDLPESFVADRIAMSPVFSPDAVAANGDHALDQFTLFLDWIERQLAGRSFLLGPQFTIADAACFHVCNFTRNSQRVFTKVEERPALSDWLDRIAGFAEGEVTAISIEAALDAAQESAPAGQGPTSAADPAVGKAVRIAPDDYATEHAEGTLTSLGTDTMTITRTDDRVGEIALHFPRLGFRLELI